MKTEQLIFSEKESWSKKDLELGGTASLVTVFGNKSLMQNQQLLKEVKIMYPNAIIVGCSTAGEINDINVMDGILSVTAIEFKSTKVRVSHEDIDEKSNIKQVGKKLAIDLISDDLVHIFVLSDGIKVNGSQLISGLNQSVPKNVAITGGLAGDGSDFKSTLVLLDDEVKTQRIVAVGFYGSKLKVGYASMGGWDSYGAIRTITKSKDNILYELDGEPALDVYKNFLGEEMAKELPSSGLLFPLKIIESEGVEAVVRTILGVDKKNKTMIFAGDVPEGSQGQFMKANFNKLVDAAGEAATNANQTKGSEVDLAILISCIGRKLILQQRIEEEVEAVRYALGDRAVFTGFYSYGEISPFKKEATCQLHNQTMTITTFREDA